MQPQKLMTMEFFMQPSAIELAHQSPHKGCKAKNKCKFCKNVEI